jgi:hypothetical protein
MPRTIALLIATLLSAALVGGCGSSGNNNGSGGNGSGGDGGGDVDMSAAAGGSTDLGMTLPPDMQPAYGCHALAACVDACTDQASCGLCVASATQQARMLYNTASRCVRRECFPHPDGGAAPCTNGGGTPSAGCTQCQDDSIKMTGTCGADTTYCGTCYAAYAACEADTP